MKITPSLLLLSLLTFLEGHAQVSDPAAWWDFTLRQDESIQERIQGQKYPLAGEFSLVRGVRGGALYLDGLTTRIEREDSSLAVLDGPFTIECWIALQAYPWNDTAILDQALERLPVEEQELAREQESLERGLVGVIFGEPEFSSRVFFGLDSEGHLLLEIAGRRGVARLVSRDRLPLLSWSHVAASFDPGKGLSLFLNGKETGHLAVDVDPEPFHPGPVRLGQSLRRRAPVGTIREANLEWPSRMVLEGVLDELRIHARVLEEGEVRRVYNLARPSDEQPLEHPDLPSGPVLRPPGFIAEYTRLRYEPTWERIWRVGEYPDLLVTFDRTPVRLLFWRGTNYGAAWVSETRRWMGDQSVERSGGTRWGTAEHMNDKQTRYSHVRIIQNHAARKVIQWKYALSDIAYEISRIDETPRGEWAEEFYYVYPEGAAVRHQVLYTDDLNHEWQETIVINPPGTRPEDNIDIEALSLANLEGESHRYSWRDGVPEGFSRPNEPNIQLTHLKSRYKPFIIFEPRPFIKPFTASIRSRVSHFPWWNHWPVSQIPNDGRNARSPGRPSHSSLTQSLEDSDLIQRRGDGGYEVVTLTGMTDRTVTELVPTAKSWIQPASLEVSYGGSLIGYDRLQKAFVVDVTRKEEGTDLVVKFDANPDRPLVYPVLICRGWRGEEVEVLLDGHLLLPARDYRLGFEDHLDRRDLVLWLDLQAEIPKRLVVKPAVGN